MALAFGALILLGIKVWFQNGCGLDRYFPIVFELAIKFPWQKSGNISPYFHGGNLVALCLRYVIARQTLFLPSFRYENTAMGTPHFHSKNLVESHIWYAMVHRQGFAFVYTVRIDILAL